jgi:plasmid stabilization system protein ParE
MKEYIVRYNSSAIRDLEKSFEWGVNNWGETQARKWIVEIQSATLERLSQIPSSCQVAPESTEFKIEVRQFIYGRYRVLFTIRKDTVFIFHVRGPVVS